MTSTTHDSRTGTTPARGAAYGAIAGVLASVAMGMYAMVASYLKDTGFFTPLHHIGTVFVEPAAMMESMKAAMEQGDAFVITPGVALLGLVIHMTVGAAYGAVLGLVLANFDFGAGVRTAIGAAYGALVFVVSAFVGLPLAAAIFGVDDLAEGPMAGMNTIADMAEMAGWGVFFSEHVFFGAIAGLLIAAILRKRS